MPLTPATLPQHELIGLPVRVVAASDPGLVGLAGEVVMETTGTLSIEGDERGDSEGDGPSGSRAEPDDGRRVWQVPKAGTMFEFTLPDGRTNGAGTASGETVTVEGERLESRPARRTERTGDSKWR